MGQMPTEEHSTVLTKIVMYVGGVMLGLFARLAAQNKSAKITWKDVFLQTSVSFACAWLVWNALTYFGRPDLANVVSVVVGRFADSILMIFWRSLKKGVSSAADEIEKID